MSSVHVSLRSDQVGVITFDQPGSKANVLSPQMWTDFDHALSEAAALPNIRGLILTSAKPGIFIAGADLKVIGGATTTHDPAVRQLIEQGLSVLEKVERFPVPTVAVIDGAALGGGLEVALACDFRIVGNHPKCMMGLPEVTLGLIPGWGGTQRLPRIVGPATALETLTTAQPFAAGRAIEVGLADAAFDSENLIDSAANLILSRNHIPKRMQKSQPLPSEITAGFKAAIPAQPTAVRVAGLVMEQGLSLPLDQAIPLETAAFMQLAGSSESKQLIEAFFNRKK